MPVIFSDQQKEQFEAEGYLIVENFISDTTVDELRKLVIGMANYERAKDRATSILLIKVDSHSAFGI